MRFVATVFPLASPRHSRRPLPWQTLARAVVTTGVALAAALVSHGAVAQGFSVLVSPPRFELRAKPGETLREAVQLDNVSSQPATLKVGSADWRFDADAAIRFQDALAPGSCRPWLAIESHDLSLAANGKHRFRFQISVPADAPAGECRLALMFEGAPVDVKGAVPIPVSGRIAVIVYVVVGDAHAQLDLVSTGVADHQGTTLPVLTIRNTGQAHARLGGLRGCRGWRWPSPGAAAGKPADPAR